MKQTAVEWLIFQLQNNTDKTNAELKYYIDKAKEMERQDIIDAYESLEHRHGENYYKETFKQ